MQQLRALLMCVALQPPGRHTPLHPRPAGPAGPTPPPTCRRRWRRKAGRARGARGPCTPACPKARCSRGPGCRTARASVRGGGGRGSWRGRVGKRTGRRGRELVGQPRGWELTCSSQQPPGTSHTPPHPPPRNPHLRQPPLLRPWPQSRACHAFQIKYSNASLARAPHSAPAPAPSQRPWPQSRACPCGCWTGARWRAAESAGAGDGDRGAVRRARARGGSRAWRRQLGLAWASATQHGLAWRSSACDLDHKACMRTHACKTDTCRQGRCASVQAGSA